ncbi:hypothetical protein HRS9122_10457 [Pyrenophora teres f. teres]|nr:hypothetical protein HRS9122_10457 [Pyrenophora teres f. teres]
MLQVVLADDRVEQANELEQYLEKDKSVSMGLATRSHGMRWLETSDREAIRLKQPGFNAFIKYLGEQDHEAAQPTGSRALLASSYTSSDDVVFGATVTDGTRRGRHEAMAGPTIATVPVRVRVQHSHKVSEFLHSVQQQATEMIPFQTLLIVQPGSNGDIAHDALGEWRSHSDLQDFTTYALMCNQAKARPDAGDLRLDGDMTYGELDVLSAGSRHLVELGVGPETLCRLCFEKSMWTVWPCWPSSSRGAFLLLDPSLPTSVCADVSQSLCEALSSIRSQCAARQRLGCTVVIVNADSALQLAHHASPITSVRPTHTAYVIFTSGSTGEPKGCRIEHRAASSAVTAHGRYLGMQASTRTLQFASYAFAGSLVELLMNLCHGGCICVLSEEERRTDLASAVPNEVNWPS